MKPKYRNNKVTYDGILFDSKKEAAYYQELLWLQKAGEISDLELQPKYELAPACILDGRKHRALTYTADFKYTKDGVPVVCDVKGFKTKEYKRNRHFMKSIYNIEIVEI